MYSTGSEINISGNTTFVKNVGASDGGKEYGFGQFYALFFLLPLLINLTIS